MAAWRHMGVSLSGIFLWAAGAEPKDHGRPWRVRRHELLQRCIFLIDYGADKMGTITPPLPLSPRNISGFLGGHFLSGFGAFWGDRPNKKTLIPSPPPPNKNQGSVLFEYVHMIGTERARGSKLENINGLGFLTINSQVSTSPPLPAPHPCDWSRRKQGGNVHCLKSQKRV